LTTYTLENQYLKAIITPYGARLHQLWVATPQGWINVVQHCQKIEDYTSDPWYKGAVIGPVAGRLRQPIIVSGKTIALDETDKPLLHSGSLGWSHHDWTLHSQSKEELTLSLTALETIKGFPGNINAQVSYRLMGATLCLEYHAESSMPTPMNMTNHSYFNLAPSQNFQKHRLQLNAKQRLEMDSQQLPTGKVLENNSPEYDFLNEKEIGTVTLDDYFLIPDSGAVGSLFHPAHRIRMDIGSNQNGVVVFTPESFPAICFETEAPPDALHHSHFEDILCTPERPYRQKVHFAFSVIE
jgi:aldose 1-epimerase